eukprot:scaffold9.g3109.t1
MSVAAARRRSQQEQWGEERAWGAPSEAHAQQDSGNYMQRDIARLGGEGVASIFRGGLPEQRSPGTGAAGAGGSFMSALSSLKPGLSDAQKQKAATAREQLKRDLEQQMAEKRAAETRRKAELHAQEEAEEERIRAYYAGLAAEEAAARGAAPAAHAVRAPAPAHAAGDGPAAGDGRRGAQAARAEARGLWESVGPTRAEVAVTAPGVMVMVPRRRQQAEETVQPPTRTNVRSPPAVEAETSRVAGPTAQEDAPTAAWAASPASLAAARQLAQQQFHQLWGSPYVAAMLGLGLPGQALAAAQLPYLPVLPPPGIQVPAAAAISSDVAAALRQLQAEQAVLKERVSAQDEVVSQLQGDVLSARRERDRARQDLSRVQQLLDARAGGHGAGGWAQDDGLTVSSHLLPAAIQTIPSRLGTPAGAGGGLAGGAAAAYYQHPLDSFYRQQRQPGLGGPVEAGDARAAGQGAAGRGVAAGGRNAPAGNTKAGMGAAAMGASKAGLKRSSGTGKLWRK